MRPLFQCSAWNIQSREGEFGKGSTIQFDWQKSNREVQWYARYVQIRISVSNKQRLFFLKKKTDFSSTAPGAYCPEKVKLDPSPQFSFGLRPAVEKPNDTPGIYYESFIIECLCWICIFFHFSAWYIQSWKGKLE